MGIISWKVNGMKREKKKGKKTKYFTGFTEALFTYQKFFGPELLFVKRANENCVCVPYKTYLLRTGQLNCMRLVLMQLNKR